MLEGSILQKLYAAHQGSKRPLNLGVYYKNTLVALCHALEDFVLEARSRPLMITAFQQGKWYLQEADRYGDLADKAEQVAIMAASDAGFAQHPTSQKDNVALVSLSGDDPVAREWHLMILSPTYTAMVLCQELSEADYGTFGVPEHDLERKFYGFWTFEPDLVAETVEIAIDRIARYDKDLAEQLQEQTAAIISNSRNSDREDVGIVVSQVVDYLQASQGHLSRLEEDARASFLAQSHALDDNLLSNEMQAFLRMAQIIDQADIDNPMAAAEVTALAETIAQLLDLPAWQQKRLRLASLLHRLAPNLGGALIEATDRDSDGPYCPLTPGIQALRAMPRMRAIARIITHQSEHWDGSGTPGGLAFDRIPLESRILGLTSFFQQQVNQIRTQGEVDKNEALSEALARCQECSATVFDPKLVETLELLTIGMQQGMDIHAERPKIAAGIWLLDGASETVSAV